MMPHCEDAPCCGCCGTNIMGQYQGEQDMAPDYDPYEDYDDSDLYEGEDV